MHPPKIEALEALRDKIINLITTNTDFNNDILPIDFLSTTDIAHLKSILDMLSPQQAQQAAAEFDYAQEQQVTQTEIDWVKVGESLKDIDQQLEDFKQEDDRTRNQYDSIEEHPLASIYSQLLILSSEIDIEQIDIDEYEKQFSNFTNIDKKQYTGVLLSLITTMRQNIIGIQSVSDLSSSSEEDTRQAHAQKQSAKEQESEHEHEAHISEERFTEITKELKYIDQQLHAFKNQSTDNQEQCLEKYGPLESSYTALINLALEIDKSCNTDDWENQFINIEVCDQEQYTRSLIKLLTEMLMTCKQTLFHSPRSVADVSGSSNGSHRFNFFENQAASHSNSSERHLSLAAAEDYQHLAAEESRNPAAEQDCLQDAVAARRIPDPITGGDSVYPVILSLINCPARAIHYATNIIKKAKMFSTQYIDLLREKPAGYMQKLNALKHEDELIFLQFPDSRDSRLLCEGITSRKLRTDQYMETTLSLISVIYCMHPHTKEILKLLQETDPSFKYPKDLQKNLPHLIGPWIFVILRRLWRGTGLARNTEHVAREDVSARLHGLSHNVENGNITIKEFIKRTKDLIRQQFDEVDKGDKDRYRSLKLSATTLYRRAEELSNSSHQTSYRP